MAHAASIFVIRHMKPRSRFEAFKSPVGMVTIPCRIVQLALLVAMTGCYKTQYLQTKAELEHARLEAERNQRAHDECQKELADERATAETLQEELVATKAAIEAAMVELEGNKALLAKLESITTRGEAERQNLAETIRALSERIEQQEELVFQAQEAQARFASVMAALDNMIADGIPVKIEELPDNRRKISITVPDNVLFALADWKLSELGVASIRKHATLFRKVLDFDGHTRIDIIGHTDSNPILHNLVGRDKRPIRENYFLGLERARSVQEELVKVGLPQTNLRASSRSYAEPICNERPITDACHERNRRVEYEIALALQILRGL